MTRFDSGTGNSSVIATIVGNPGLSGVAYNSNLDRLYVSALNHGGIYELNATTGAVLGFNLLGIGPGGIAIGQNGNLFVTDFTSNNVREYDTSFALQGTISIPVAGVTSGLGFANNGDMIVATAGTGLFRFDGSSTSPFNNSPIASAHIAVDSTGNVYVGHGLGQSNSVSKFSSDGTFIRTIDIDPSLLNSTGFGSSLGTSPGGVTFDADGNLIIAVLGQSNPSDQGGERGGLFKFDTDGNLLQTFVAGSEAFSSVAFVSAVPEPGSLAILALCGSTAFGVRLWKKRKALVTHL